VVIGGGAAGFFCAINAAMSAPHLKVILLEKTGKLLSKVKVSGGGRCNVTHHEFDIDRLSKNYPRGQHFLRKAFYQFNTKHTIEWFEQFGVALHVESDGRMFPVTNQSQTIIDCFLELAKQYRIEIRLHQKVIHITKKSDQFVIQLQNEKTIQADYVCITAGGFPNIDQFKWLQFEDKIKINTPIPSLFTFNIPNNEITQLMGISVPQAEIKIKETKFKFTGPLLITHWGCSGPAVLKLSAFAARELFEKDYHFTITVNWLGTMSQTELQKDWKSITQHINQTIQNHNPFKLPSRLWQYLLQTVAIDGTKKWKDISVSLQNKLIISLTASEFDVKGKTTFKEEFVTSGGVSLEQINHATMEHKMIENLFFAGEVLDIDGITGGFNFQNAWTTAFIAAKGIASK
jgi:predicted Rossmann fold flavoprotein